MFLESMQLPDWSTTAYMARLIEPHVGCLSVLSLQLLDHVLSVKRELMTVFELQSMICFMVSCYP